MNNSKYLYVGCGAHNLRGFLHADISVYKLSKIKSHEQNKIDIFCDITKKIPLKDGSIKLVFSRDTLEHLTWKELINHFIECNRILESNGVIRMSLPNLDKMIDRYKNKDEDLDYAIKNSEVSKHISPLENHTDLFINRILFHDHFYLHNFDTMKRALEKCGFGRIKNVSPGETRIDQLKDIFFEAENGSEQISFQVEASKISSPKTKKYQNELPSNIIKKIFAILFNISISPYNKRQPMFPSKKWFLEKYLKIKQNFKKN